jgi:hypothetical protein
VFSRLQNYRPRLARLLIEILLLWSLWPRGKIGKQGEKKSEHELKKVPEIVASGEVLI